MATKYDLSPTSTLLGEFIQMTTLFVKTNKTTTGNPTFTSSTSGLTYTVSNNSGEVGMIALLKVALLDYMVLATDINGKAEASDLTTHTANTTTAHGVNTKMPLAGGTYSGEVNHADNLVTRPYLKDYAEAVTTDATSTGSETLDIVNGNVFDCTLTGDVTYTFSNPSASGRACSFTLIIRQGATPRAITFPASIKWANDEIPSLDTANKTSILVFMTVNSGTRWYGCLGGNNFTT
jgi:hypothetical protein